MIRHCYQLTLRLHPPFFQERFAAEMMWIFDQTATERERLFLLFDCLASLVRQWTRRRELWNRPPASGEDPAAATPVFYMFETPKRHPGALVAGAALSLCFGALLLLGMAARYVPAFTEMSFEPSRGLPDQPYIALPDEARGEPERAMGNDVCLVRTVEYWQLPASTEARVRRNFPIRPGASLPCSAPFHSISALHEVHPGLRLGLLVTRDRSISIRISMASGPDLAAPHIAFSAWDGFSLAR
jgi:hypothetical protein